VLRLPNATYVEDVVVLTGGLQVDHTRLEIDGGVVDPTPRFAEAANGECTYFASPRWTRDEILELFTPDHEEHRVTPVLPPDKTQSSPPGEAWIRAKLAAFRHVSALYLMRTRHPAIVDDKHEATLERVLRSYWAQQVDADRAGCQSPDAGSE